MNQVLGVDSRIAFVALVVLVAVQRLVELSVSKRNFCRALERGGVESGAQLYPWMAAMHVGFLIAGPVEVLLLDRPWVPTLAAVMVTSLLLAQLLRYWAVQTLGDRWTTRVVCVPGDPLVTTGPYRWLRHPNYVAVAVEFAALPLIHTAWLTAASFSLMNAIVLRRRVVVEDAALRQYCRRPEPSRP